MNHQNSRLNQHQQEQNALQQQSASQTKGMEFASADAAIRYDLAQTVVPPKVTERLRDSIRGEPQPRDRPWWRKILGA